MLGFTILIFSSQRIKASYERDFVADLRTFLRDSDRACHHTSTEGWSKIQTRERAQAGNQPKSEFLWYEKLKTKYTGYALRTNVEMLNWKEELFINSIAVYMTASSITSRLLSTFCPYGGITPS